MLRLVSSVRLSRTFSTRALPSAIYLEASTSHDPAITTSPEDLSPSQRNALDSALRVDQAGEIAANYIYAGQMAVLGSHKVAGPIIQVG